MKRLRATQAGRERLKRLLLPCSAYNCCAIGDVGTLEREYLSQPDFDVNCADEHGVTCLMTALMFDQRLVAERLLKAGANPSLYCTARVDFPLTYAIRHDMVDMVKLLIAHGADVNSIHDSLGGSLLHYCSCFTHGSIGEMVHLLVEAGANVRAFYKGFTPLYEALYTNNMAVLKALLECGANPNEEACTKEEEGSVVDDFESADVLSDDHASSTVTFQESDFPLFFAVRNGDLEMVQLLVSNGADVNLKSAEDDSTPLHLAAVYGREDDCEMIKYLLDHGADVNAVDLLGATPLADAASHGLTNIMALLVERGADINGGAGWSAVHAATECNSIETMRFLIARGGDVNMVSAQGLTPLSLAARVPGRKALLQLLLAAGAVHNGEDDWDRDMARRIHASARYRVGGNVAYDMDKLVIQ